MKPEDIYFISWDAWEKREKATWDCDVPTDFGLAGLYLLANFKDERDVTNESPPTHLDPNVIYIGVSDSPIHRLGSNSHGAVNRYKAKFKDPSLSNLYCTHWQSRITNYELKNSESGEAKRTYFLYLERKLIWEYATRFNRLPALNRK